MTSIDETGLSADITVHLGRIENELAAGRRQGEQFRRAIRIIPGIPVPPITTTSGKANYPELLSPRTGFWWFIYQATAATFSAGSVNLYRGGTGAAMTSIDETGLSADITVHLGRIENELAAGRRQGEQFRRAIRIIPGIPVPPITTTSGKANYPELLSPRTGFWWFIYQATAATFSAGSVNLYRGGTGAEDPLLSDVTR